MKYTFVYFYPTFDNKYTFVSEMLFKENLHLQKRNNEVI